MMVVEQPKTAKEIISAQKNALERYEKLMADCTEKVREQDKEIDQFNKALQNLEAENFDLKNEKAELLEMIEDLFNQACADSNGKYNHHCISTYEYTQKFLVEIGRIKIEDCNYQV